MAREGNGLTQGGVSSVEPPEDILIDRARTVSTDSWLATVAQAVVDDDIRWGVHVCPGASPPWLRCTGSHSLARTVILSRHGGMSYGDGLLTTLE